MVKEVFLLLGAIAGGSFLHPASAQNWDFKEIWIVCFYFRVLNKWAFVSFTSSAVLVWLLIQSWVLLYLGGDPPPPPCFHLEGMDACIYDYLASVDILALLTGRYENPFLFLSLSHLYVQGRRTSYWVLWLLAKSTLIILFCRIYLK